MTVCQQCNGTGGMFSDTDFEVDNYGNKTAQLNNAQNLSPLGCSQCNGKGYLTNFGVA
jgi:hypothetical protein